MKAGTGLVLAFGTFALISCRADGAPDGGSDSAIVHTNAQPPGIGEMAGRRLFLKNCAHCHGADARGDEGPDLHGLDVSDQWIAERIRNGKAGQMTAFAGKLQGSEINILIAYLRTLK
jgi:mono/diheme cytochrome c family protein